MNKWLIGLIVLVVVVGGYFVLNAKKVAPGNGEIIKIGAILGLTGSAATDALNIKRGLDLAKEDLAKKGIVVDINYQDDNTDPKQTISGLKYFFSTFQPQAIIGPTWSFLESAAASTIASAEVVAYAPANTSEFVEVMSKYQFHGAPRNALKQQPVADWLKLHNKKRVAIIVDKSAWGESNEKAFVAAAIDAGAMVVLNEAIAPFTADVGGQVAAAVTKAKAASVDVILWTGYEPDAMALVQARARLGVDAPIIAASTVYTQLLSRGMVSAEELKDVYVLSVPIPATSDFFVRFKAKYGEAPGPYSDRAYDGLMLLVEAIQYTPNASGSSIADYLRTRTQYKGITSDYEFNENGDVKGGTWVIQPIVK